MLAPPTQTEKAAAFLRLHQPGAPLLIPNPWDAGSARLLAYLGFEALATTSGGFAASLGRLDGSVTRDEAIAHCVAIVAATDLPVSADLENGFADSPAGVATTVEQALGAGLVGCSIEDHWVGGDVDVYPIERATERIAAAAEAAHGRDPRLVLTARAENYLYGRPDVDDTVRRLQAYQAAGADVLYAPGLVRPEDIRAVTSSVDRPVNVLVRPGGPTVSELAELGVARISVGSAFAQVAVAAFVDAARELKDEGTHTFLPRAAAGTRIVRDAFS